MKDNGLTMKYGLYASILRFVGYLQVLRYVVFPFYELAFDFEHRWVALAQGSKIHFGIHQLILLGVYRIEIEDNIVQDVV